MSSYTLVTGASTGIGKAIATDCARSGENLVLVARSKARLEALAEELRQAHGIEVCICCEDLSGVEAPSRVSAFCREQNITVGRLVNCAGFSMTGDFARITEEELLQMAMVNMVALAGLTRKFLPAMIERRKGAVINIASMAAFQGVPGMALYSATKAFVVNLTEALYEETRGTGVRVFAVCPGFIDNESFYERAGHNRARILTPISGVAVVLRSVRRGLRSSSISIRPTLFDRLMIFLQRFLPRKPVVRLAGLFAGARSQKE